MNKLELLAARAAEGGHLDDAEVWELAALARRDPAPVLAAARDLRDATTGPRITFSKKVFIPLTKLCRDSCGYCTFAHPPIPGERAFLTIDEVVDIAGAGQAQGCREALFTLGDKPERKWSEAQSELEEMGYATTIEYLADACRAVLDRTTLLPHTNPGTLSPEEVAVLREVSVSQGLMLETLSERLLTRGMAHFGAPDKRPAVRLATLEAAGEAQVPFTSGILVGIGETYEERIEALLAIRATHERHGHIQEVIVQNFRAKPDTLMAHHGEPDVEEMRIAIALTRLIMGPDVGVQAPPNLSPREFGTYLDAGLSDWGGVSPVTPDHVNPEAPWPHLEELRRTTEGRGFLLLQRLAVYPEMCATPAARTRWLHPSLHGRVLDETDSEGYVRPDDGGWFSGADVEPPERVTIAVEAAAAGAWRVPGRVSRPAIDEALARARGGEDLSVDDLTLLFSARGAEAERLFAVADELRKETVGDEVTYVVNRNINYTNMCYFRCGFCAFSKGPASLNLRGTPYLLTPEEVAQRAVEAWELGATEVCMQGGIHHSFTGDNYVAYLTAVKKAVPEMHVHAFTALEVAQGARASGSSVESFLRELKDAGLATLPGTAAEILDDEIREIICPDKIMTEEWCEVHRMAHALGLRSNATIMYGTVESPKSWAKHIVRVRDLHKEIVQEEISVEGKNKNGAEEQTSLQPSSDRGEARVASARRGLFEFVPLPFVHMAAPIYLKGRARRGPTMEEAVKMHAVARLGLHGHIRNIQVSWVKMGVDGSKLALQAGANDLGGTLMDENISRAAGASHGQELTTEHMEELIRSIGRLPRKRTTLYGAPSPRVK